MQNVTNSIEKNECFTGVDYVLKASSRRKRLESTSIVPVFISFSLVSYQNTRKSTNVART